MSLNCPKCGVPIKLEMGVVLAETPIRKNTYPALPIPKPAEPMLVHNLGALLMRINDRSLAPHELKFVSDVRRQFGKDGAKARLTEKQGAWLERIAKKTAA